MMSSYSCVTARLTMRSVLQTQGDSRARSGPFVGLVRRPFMASCYSAYRRRARSYMQLHIISSLDSRRVNPTGVDRPRKRQEEPGQRWGDRPNTKVKGLLQGEPREDHREPQKPPHPLTNKTQEATMKGMRKTTDAGLGPLIPAVLAPP